ncbi:NAD(P)-binding domain protein [Metarhizium guizhouense ARSEF 977]|uniref:NAD(P)-binding domain protein n=1 Tax=Metarhizium guizhouense (strain ARSEF 977) TaxID=1276136 RepID=A0A0B4H1B7_METGA|nr:NAD(P)-binding domain protein [Metarhizium guizhouense ARSEF 977]
MAEPYNTPVPGSTPRSGSPVPHPLRHPTLLSTAATCTPKPRVLHLGDPIRFNLDTHDILSSQYEVVRPSAAERERAPFIQNLRDGKWGSFQAIFRPFWRTGGIVYCNGGTASADAVADLAVAMIISTFRYIPWCMAAATAASPSAFADCHLDSPAQCHNLRDRILGVVGLGNIGQRVATRCRLGFAMEIHYFDIERKSATVEGAVSARFHESLESLLETADCVVLCTPVGFGGETMINASTLKHFRQGGRFVNVSRGALVNEDDLVAALESQRLSSVALDVHANEPHVHEGLRKLAAEGRAMLTCHNGGGTVETHAAFEELSMRNVLAVLGGGPALSAVNLGHLKR